MKLLGAAGLAIVNTSVGLLIHQCILWGYRQLRLLAAARSRT
jgi:hypothetical protein